MYFHVFWTNLTFILLEMNNKRDTIFLNIKINRVIIDPTQDRNRLLCTVGCYVPLAAMYHPWLLCTIPGCYVPSVAAMSHQQPNCGGGGRGRERERESMIAYWKLCKHLSIYFLTPVDLHPQLSFWYYHGFCSFPLLRMRIGSSPKTGSN